MMMNFVTKVVWGMWSIFFLGFLFTILFFKSVENNWFGWWGELPNVQLFEKPITQKQSIVYTTDGNVIGSYYQSNRQIIPYHEISPNVINALVSTEDPNFFKHSGIDFSAHSPFCIRGTITNSFLYQLYHSRRPNLNERGTLYNDRFFRQIGHILKRFFTLLKIERTYTKEEIITMHLNYEDFGHNSHGIVSASKTFFNKSVSELNIQEASLLVGILKAPTTYSPRLHPNRANKRRNQILFSLFREKFITKVVYDSLCKLPIELGFNLSNSNHNIAPHFRYVVKKEALKILKRHEKKTGEKYNLYSDGLKIFTTLDSQLQKHAESAVKENQANTVFLSIAPQTGFVKAWVSDFKNHVLTKHEVGSLFKPIIYSTLLNYSNYTLETELEEKPITFKLENGEIWIPRGKPTGDKITLKRYFTHVYPFFSLNDQLVEKVGIPNIVEHAQELGLEIPKDEQSPILSLGITYQNLYDMVKAYSVFVNEGKLIPPVFITQIQDQDGRVIYQHTPQVSQAISKKKALDMIELLEERQNLALIKRIYGIEKIGGMTGISQQNRDHWFIGFTPELISGCWVEGKLKKSKNMAMPIFGKYMQTIYTDSTITTVK